MRVPSSTRFALFGAALTAAMQAVVKRSVHGRVSAIMNAGTSVGVAMAVPAVVFLSDAWRLAYGVFAALALLAAAAAWRFIPSGSPVVGLLIERLGYANGFATVSTIGMLMALLSPFYPRHLPSRSPSRSPG